MASKFLIIGSGFSGAVLAHELAKNTDCHIEIWEERNHIGGNCHTSRDEETGIMVHRYGPHIFNTNNKEIWDYVNSFSEFRTYVHRVKAVSKGQVYSLPINLSTLNQFFKKTFTPQTAKDFLESLSDRTIDEPKNFEEQALSFIGKKLYQAFFEGYTKKQWGCEPKELPASVLKRIPVRFNYDDNYHNSSFTGIPVNGYTDVIAKLLRHPNIHIYLNKKFLPLEEEANGYDHIFYTGPLDAFFNYQYGKLGYRTVTFESSLYDGDYQGTAQMNFCDEEIPYTRITEHKHFTPWEKHDKTIVFKEFSKETDDDIPYYPKRLQADKILLKKYRQKAESISNVSFLGRLATYRYMDMDYVIEEAIDFSKKIIAGISANMPLPVFPNKEN